MEDAGRRSCHCRAVAVWLQGRKQFRFRPRLGSGKLGFMTCTPNLDSLNSLDSLSPQKLRALAAELIVTVRKPDRELVFRKTLIDQLPSAVSVLEAFASQKPVFCDAKNDEIDVKTWAPLHSVSPYARVKSLITGRRFKGTKVAFWNKSPFSYQH